MFQSLDVHTHGGWPELGEKGFIAGEFTGIARIPQGTVEGNTSITIRIKLPDGRTVLAGTTLALLRAAMIAINTAEEMEI